MITRPILKALTPTTPDDVLELFVDPLNTLLPARGINSRQRVACFLAQVIHESAGFTARVENLNYSADGLRSIFPRYFPNAIVANAYARNPERIANRVYASRMGNGNEISGDGWRYRGKSLIQVTGHDNHVAFAKWMQISVDEAVVYLVTVEGAIMGAVWFWTVNALNGLADLNLIDTISKRVNGGTIGLTERRALWAKALTLF